MGPLGLLSPHPGVSYLFSGTDTNGNGVPQLTDTEGSLWTIANATVGGGGPAVVNHALGSAGQNWTPALAELVLKADGKFKVRHLGFLPWLLD
jgi:hypothetical protein